MRNLAPCTFEAGTRTIHIQLHEMTGVENIRLIVNETQKVVICSSMQKDHITSCVKDNVNGGWDVTYKNDIPALVSGDALTVEIDLGNHNYIDGTDWILKAKTSTEPFDVGEGLGEQLADALNNNADLTALFRGTKIQNLTIRKPVNPDITKPMNGRIYEICRNCASIVNADLSGIVGLGSDGMRYAFTSSTLESVNLDNLEYIGPQSLNNAFAGSHIRSLSLPKLHKIANNYTIDQIAYNCVYLESVSIPELAAKFYIQAMPFQGCPNLRTVICHPLLLAYSANSYLLRNSPSVENLTLSYDASDNVYLNDQANLNATSVQNILEHCCNNNMSSKTITFYSGGLTVQDDASGTLQTLYNTVVDTYGANIANLNITPYSA